MINSWNIDCQRSLSSDTRSEKSARENRLQVPKKVVIRQAFTACSLASSLVPTRTILARCELFRYCWSHLLLINDNMAFVYSISCNDSLLRWNVVRKFHFAQTFLSVSTVSRYCNTVVLWIWYVFRVQSVVTNWWNMGIFRIF